MKPTRALTFDELIKVHYDVIEIKRILLEDYDAECGFDVDGLVKSNDELIRYYSGERGWNPYAIADKIFYSLIPTE